MWSINKNPGGGGGCEKKWKSKAKRKKKFSSCPCPSFSFPFPTSFCTYVPTTYDSEMRAAFAKTSPKGLHTICDVYAWFFVTTFSQNVTAHVERIPSTRKTEAEIFSKQKAIFSPLFFLERTCRQTRHVALDHILPKCNAVTFKSLSLFCFFYI